MARATRFCGDPSEHIGPLVDDGFEYSAIGMVEPKVLQDSSLKSEIMLDRIPKSLNGPNH